jgi:hypothetical protein
MELGALAVHRPADKSIDEGVSGHLDVDPDLGGGIAVGALRGRSTRANGRMHRHGMIGQRARVNRDLTALAAMVRLAFAGVRGDVALRPATETSSKAQGSSGSSSVERGHADGLRGGSPRPAQCAPTLSAVSRPIAGTGKRRSTRMTDGPA